jgi:hypothetical protein
MTLRLFPSFSLFHYNTKTSLQSKKLRFRHPDSDAPQTTPTRAHPAHRIDERQSKCYHLPKGKVYGCEMWRNGENLVVRGKIASLWRNQTWLPYKGEKPPLSQEPLVPRQPK